MPPGFQTDAKLPGNRTAPLAAQNPSNVVSVTYANRQQLGSCGHHYAPQFYVRLFDLWERGKLGERVASLHKPTQCNRRPNFYLSNLQTAHVF